jgi:uncharacterized protein YuzE
MIHIWRSVFGNATFQRLGAESDCQRKVGQSMKALEAAKRIRYSPDSDVLYFLLAEGEEEYFEEPIPGVHIEYDESGHVIGIEILHASKLLKDFLRRATPK